MVDPLTGVYAAPAGNEVMGAKLAVEQINAKGGMLGRQVELLVEDSANDVGTGVQKARKLIERDQVNFIIGDVNSGIAAGDRPGHRREEGPAHRFRRPHRRHHRQGLQMERLPRLQHHADGGQFGLRAYCSANTARNGTSSRRTTPSATRCRMPARTDLKKLGGTVTGNELTPLGTTDFSAYLIKARAANPDVLILLVQGSDMINCLKQVVQFGINKQIHVAGTQQELESLAGAAAGGAHRHLDVRMVLEAARHRRRRQIRRRYSQGQWRQGADRAALVRLHLGHELRAGRQPGKNARRGQARPGARRISSCPTRSSCSRTSATTARATIS